MIYRVKWLPLREVGYVSAEISQNRKKLVGPMMRFRGREEAPGVAVDAGNACLKRHGKQMRLRLGQVSRGGEK